MARNTNRQGANFELTVMHDLQGCQNGNTPCKSPAHAGWTGYGYTCLRSSGSRGAVDVVAVGPLQTGFERRFGLVDGLLFIQCKITNPLISPAERLAIQSLALRARARPIVAHWAKDATTKLMRVHYRQLTGPGPKDWEHWLPGEDD